MAGPPLKTPLKRRAPLVGEVVHFRADLAVVLPLLVTRVTVLPRQSHEGTRWAVSGQVFTDPTVHSDAAWIRDNRFFKPHADQPNFLVQDILPGREFGQWEFADARQPA